MQWIEVSVPTRSDEIDDVCAQLAELGAGGMVVEDETDFQQFLEQNHQYWDYVDDALEAQFRGVSRIKFYLADDDDGRAQLEAIRAGIGRALTTAAVRDSDWENNWRQYYQPIEVGERLVVVPEWLDAPADGRLPLRLDPGLIFGTGSHATTRMCLAALEHCAGAGRTVLDLGCGLVGQCDAAQSGACDAGGTGSLEDAINANTKALEKTNSALADMIRQAGALVLSDNMRLGSTVAASGTARVAAAANSYHREGDTNITQNIYSKAQTAADLQREARWEADRAKAQSR